MKRATREWVRKAEANFHGAKSLALTTPPLHDLVCFHCQQCGEKYLKALLEELGIAVVKTHDLEQLLTILGLHYASLRSLHRGLVFLTRFAVDIRYPDEYASKREATPRCAGRGRCGRNVAHCWAYAPGSCRFSFLHDRGRWYAEVSLPFAARTTSRPGCLCLT